jgi:hypothetical protein
MRLQRQTKKRRLVDAVATYLKLKAIAKAVKAARKAVAGAPKAVKALPLLAGVGAAGAVGGRKSRPTRVTTGLARNPPQSGPTAA